MSDALEELLRRDAARLQPPDDLVPRVGGRLVRRRRIRTALLLFPAMAASLVAALWLATAEHLPTPAAAPMALAPAVTSPTAPLAPTLTFASEAAALAKDARGVGRFFIGCLPVTVAAR